jgi:large subunit ribosomal protein L3
MTIGVIGRKAGMTRVFTEAGASTPITVIQIEPNRVAQVKTLERDGYRAIQVAAGTQKPSRVNKPMAGHYSGAGIVAGRSLTEFRLTEEEAGNWEVGADLGAGLFEVGQSVDVRGRTKGKGFAGGIKRHHFSHQDYTHGNSVSHRAAGSIGQNQSPGRVLKGKRMAGHLGDVQRVQQNLEVVRVDTDRGLLLVKGAVPGSTGGDLIVTPSVKQGKKG